MSRIEN